MFATYAEMRSPKQLKGKWKRVKCRGLSMNKHARAFVLVFVLALVGGPWYGFCCSQPHLSTNKLSDVMNETASPEINSKFTVNSVKLRQWSVQLNLGFSLITPILFIDPAVPSSSSALSILRASFLSRNSLSGMRLIRPSNPSRRLDLSLLLESSLYVTK